MKLNMQSEFLKIDAQPSNYTYALEYKLTVRQLSMVLCFIVSLVAVLCERVSVSDILKMTARTGNKRIQT